MAHQNPKQLLRLLESLKHQDADIYIHLDSKTDISSFQNTLAHCNVTFLSNRVNVIWGEYSVIDATLKGMEEILGKGIVYSHINLLSGADYPLQPVDSFHDLLKKNVDKTFIWFDKIFNDWVHGQARVNTYYFGDYHFPGRYQLSKVVSKLLPNRKMPGGLVLYGRSQWLTITSEAAIYVLKYLKDHSGAVRYFRMTWAVDEILFQTVLCNSAYRELLVNDNLRYLPLKADFRPVVFGIGNKEELISSGKFFARKFDLETDSAIFDFLDKKIGIKV